ncbi:glycosyltransferase [Sphingobacterium faecium]|uniref:glycosyltransferase n=1 Tax=Sphingobacterium faecium TaxID=34087 RepID=UPI0012914F0C|nr:glycosyltransferase [Sphingobacterium faecium]MQP30313.1 glycosyltransferase [Sphingobacterium faecium]
MKILFVQHLHFINGSGGTEKICSFLANNFVKQGHQVEIATNENISGSAIFPIDDLIQVTNIYKHDIVQKEQIPTFNYRGRNPFLWIFCKLKKKFAKMYNAILKWKMNGEEGIFIFNLKNRSKKWEEYINELNPDIIITMSISSLLEITYNTKIRPPIINSVNGRPDYDYTNIFGGRKPFEVRLLKESFQKLAGVQLLFDSYRSYLPDCFNGKAVIIPNPVIRNSYTVNHFQIKARYKIIHAARLDTGCKQQHLAIMCFAQLASKYVNWDFELWGEGPDRKLLEKQILDLNMQERIFLMGFTDNPIQKLSEADIFVFPSKYEGFGLALVEAMSVGLPCIGLKSCSGVNELIKHEETGFLAENVNEMMLFMDKLMENKTLRYYLGRNAKNFVEVFNESKISADWNQFIKEMLKLSIQT